MRTVARRALRIVIWAVAAGLTWYVGNLLLMYLYFTLRIGPGYVPVLFGLLGAVGMGGIVMGAASLLARILRKSRVGARAIVFCLAGGAALLFAASSASCAPWPAREKPEPGVKLPVVYNAGYNVSLMGFERMASTFDAHRYEKIYNALVKAGVVDRKTAVVPRAVTDEELKLFHTPQWVEWTHDPATVAKVFELAIVANLHRGFVEDNISRPFRMQTRGTVLAAQLALRYGIACTLGGGFSHAKSDHGEGFNLFADVPLAIASLRAGGWKGKVMILDVDVHHGQGNAIVYKDDPTVFVMDVYNRDNYPRKFEKIDLAIELPGGTGDQEYLKQLKAALPKALAAFKPALLIYVAGVDCYEKDRIGGLRVTEKGIEQRDRFVIDACTSRKIPMCITLSGGYWDGSWRPSAKMIQYAATKVPATQPAAGGQ